MSSRTVMESLRIAAVPLLLALRSGGQRGGRLLQRGLRQDISARPASVDPATVDVPALRAAIAGRELLPYDELDTTARHLTARFREQLDALLARGWRNGGITVPLDQPPEEWAGYERSLGFHLHAWEPLTGLLKGHGLYDDSRYLAVSHAFARRWLELYQRPLLTGGLDAALDAAEGDTGSLPWYDMGVGQRIYRLAYLLDVAARDPACPDEDIALFAAALLFHHELLSRDSFLRIHSNHGLYQALGQVAAARRFADVPALGDYHGAAYRRVELMVDRGFFASGIHGEHSAGYHFMILGSLLGAARSGLLKPEMLELLQLAEANLAWMIQPDGVVATYGDTDLQRQRRTEEAVGYFQDPAVRYLLTGGKAGAPPEFGVRGFQDAGYAFARLLPEPGRPPQEAAYLAQIASFHSRTHKHADHLSFVWHDRQRDILIDPGRFAYNAKTKPGSKLYLEGFWYSDPRRIYVERTRAHNCVEIDGRDHPRRGVRPFGSALHYAGEQDGLAVTSCELVQFGTVRHWRVLVLRPGDFLLVLDRLADENGGQHDFRQWFQLAPEWAAKSVDGRIRATQAGPDGEMGLAVASLLPQPALGPVLRGQTKPERQGWMSDRAGSLIPTPSFCLSVEGAPAAQFATLFTFGGSVEPDGDGTRMDDGATGGRFAWTDDRGARRLTVLRDGADVSVRFDEG